MDQNSNNLELGVIGINNIKKREKTQVDAKTNPTAAGKNVMTNPGVLLATK